MTPLMGDRLAQAFVDAGLPPGVLNVVHGFAAGAHLVADADVAAVTFTGSTAVGRKIHDAAHLGQRLQLELGGKNPVVVLADADLDAAADVVARSSFSLSGQACTGAGRDPRRGGDPRPTARRGRRAGRRHVARAGRSRRRDDGTADRRACASTAMERRGRHGDRRGRHASSPAAHRLADGELADGWFFPPTVLVDVSAGHDDRPRGGVRPGDRLRAGRLARRGDRLRQRRRLRAVGGDLHPLAGRRPAASPPRSRPGMVRVNRPTVGAAFNAPFGGIKQSGTATHREQLGPDGDGLLHREPHRLAGELTVDLGLDGARALVLGSSSGLGRAVAAALAAEGAAVAVVSRDARARRGGPPSDRRRRGARRRPHRSPATAARLVAEAVAALGGLDICVVNTGGGKPGGDPRHRRPTTTPPTTSMLRPALEVGPGGRAAPRRRRPRPARVPHRPLASSRRRPTSRCRR